MTKPINKATVRTRLNYSILSLIESEAAKEGATQTSLVNYAVEATKKSYSKSFRITSNSPVYMAVIHEFVDYAMGNGELGGHLA